MKNTDETGWREARGRAWLWVVVTASVTVFVVQLRRNTDAARSLLVRAAGVLVTDRHGAYNWWPAHMRQFCWAHLIRDFTAISERGGDSERIGNALLDQCVARLRGSAPPSLIMTADQRCDLTARLAA